MRLAGREDSDISRMMGVFVEGFVWDHFVTLTTRRPTTSSLIKKSFTNGFIRNLARKAQQRIAHFVVVEGDGASGGWPHVHALIYGTGKLSTDDIERSWPHGFTTIRRYDPSRAAAFYVTKAIGRAFDDFDYSRYAPPRRSGV